MAMTVTVDATKALARFSPAGIPAQVRNNLRMALPPLMRALGAQVDSNLAALKSRTRLKTTEVMKENATEITGNVSVVWTGDAKSAMVPQVLEYGARPHRITGSPLSFLWPNMPFAGLMPKTFPRVFFMSVMHPGYPGIHYMEDAFVALEPRIRTEIEKAVKDGMAE